MNRHETTTENVRWAWVAWSLSTEDHNGFDRWLAEVERAAEERGFKAGWLASGEGWNGEYPDEGKPWDESAGREELDSWRERA